MASNPQFDTLLAPAQAHRSGWLRVLFAAILFILLYIGLCIAGGAVIESGALAQYGIMPEILAGLGADRGSMSPPVIVLLLTTFLMAWVALIITVRLIHLRRFRTLFAAPGGFRWRHFLHGALMVMAFQAVTLAAYITILGVPERTGVAFEVWSLWLVPIIVLVFFQATAEELVFRGYLLQQFAVWSRNPIAWAVIPSLLFAIAHYDPSIPTRDLIMMIFHIFTVGLIAAMLVWKTGDLAAAMGIHVVNNWFAMTLIGAQGVNLGFELWLFPEDALSRMFLFDVAITVLAAWLIWKFYKPHRAG